MCLIYALLSSSLTCKNIRLDSGKHSSLLYKNLSRKGYTFYNIKRLKICPSRLQFTFKIFDLIVASALAYYTFTK